MSENKDEKSSISPATDVSHPCMSPSSIDDGEPEIAGMYDAESDDDLSDTSPKKNEDKEDHDANMGDHSGSETTMDNQNNVEGAGGMNSTHTVTNETSMHDNKNVGEPSRVNSAQADTDDEIIDVVGVDDEVIDVVDVVDVVDDIIDMVGVDDEEEENGSSAADETTDSDETSDSDEPGKGQASSSSSGSSSIDEEAIEDESGDSIDGESTDEKSTSSAAKRQKLDKDDLI